MKYNERFDELLGLLLDETITSEGLEELAGLGAAAALRAAARLRNGHNG